MIYGYCRISTKKQVIERQVRNILKVFPDAEIKQEVFTGTAYEGRKVFKQLLKMVKCGDTIVFDSVSRMSRNSETGFRIYQQLYEKGVELVFLKEPHINTATYKKAFVSRFEMTGTNTDIILKALNEYFLALAKDQIRLAFDQAEKEVQDLRQRTREGMETARQKGKQIGQKTGCKLTTKKGMSVQQGILKHSKDFGSSLTDKECMKLLGVSRNTYYKYKSILKH